MQVPLLDLRAQYAPLRARIEQAIREVCDSQRFVLGPRVAQLERDLAKYSRTKHAIGMSSGTDALLVALMALDIGPGDEVITSPYTFFATGGGDVHRGELRVARRPARQSAHGRRRARVDAGSPVRPSCRDGRAPRHRQSARVVRRRGRGASNRSGPRRWPTRGWHRRHRLLVV